MSRHSPKVFLALLLLILFSAGAIALPAAPAAAAPARQGDDSLAVALNSEEPTLVPSRQGEEAYSTFEGSLPLTDEPGAPALPEQRQIVAIPAGVTPQLVATLAPAEALPTPEHSIQPAPTLVLPENTPVEEVSALVATYPLRSDLPTADGWYPADPVRLSEPFTVRGQRMVRVEFTTVQVNLDTGELRWFAGGEVTVTWEGAAAILPDGPSSDPSYDQVLDQMVVNPDQARAWRMPAGAPDEAPLVNPQWRVTVQQRGLYRIPFSSMAGVTPATASRLAVFFGPIDEPVQQAVWVTSDSLYLVNTREAGFWSNDIVYRIELLPVGQQGLRMAQIQSDPVGQISQTFLPMILRAVQGGVPATEPQPSDESPTAPESPTTPESPEQWTLSVPYELRVEENHTYTVSEASTRPLERWHWRSLSVTNFVPTDEFTTSFSAPYHDAAAGLPVTIKSELGPPHALSTNCHRATVTVNGSHSATRQWTNNTEPFGQVITMPPSALLATGNSYKILHEYCGTSATMLFNAFIVRYQRFLQATNDRLFFFNPQSGARRYHTTGFNATDTLAFEVNTLNQPRRIVGGTATASTYTFGRPGAAEQYLVASPSRAPVLTPVPYTPSGLRTNLAHADYIIVTPPEFQTALTPLVNHIQATRGQQVRVIRTTDIYNDFGIGVMDPEAIRLFLEFAYNQWSAPKPAYVLLVGDGNYDPKNYRGNSLPNYVPPYLLDADIFLGEVPVDNAFVKDLQPGSTDGLPDMHIGRLPAGSVTNVTTMVTKIVGYEAATPGGTWRRQVTFAADEPDSGGNFHLYSDILVPYLAPGVTLSKLYLPAGTVAASVALRDQIVTRLNDGELILQYIGHAGHTQWGGQTGVWNAQRGGPTGDLALLSPSIGYRQPVSLPWACWDGYFAFPDEANQSVAEEFVRSYVDRGAIASFSPVGLDLASAHDRLAQGFYRGLFSNDGNPGTTPITELGALTLLAKMEVVNTSYARLIDTYLLIGEPGMDVALDPCIINGTCLE